jgi:hypothetical protein
VGITALILSGVAMLSRWGRSGTRDEPTSERRGQSRRGRRARLVVASKGGSYTSGQLAPRLWNFGIRNVGPATARRVQLWLTDSAEQEASKKMTNGQLALLPGEPEQVGSVEQYAPVEPAEL